MANIDFDEYQSTYKQIGQLYDFEYDKEIVKGKIAIFDDKTKNYHLYPKDKQHCQEIASALTDLMIKIKEEIGAYENIRIVSSKEQLFNMKDSEKIYILINNNGILKKKNKTICNIFKYIVLKKNNRFYELNFMRFYLSKPNTINCILRSIQFARIIDINGQKIYPYTYKDQSDKSLKKLLSNNQNFFYNPKVNINHSPKMIIDSFLRFVIFCETQNYNEFKYTILNETKEGRLKQLYWNVAFGLQAVDGLKPSEYMIDLAKANVYGEKTYDDVEKEIRKYYSCDELRSNLEQEADMVSVRIVRLLSDDSFKFDISTYCSYHKYLFSDVDISVSRKYVGKFRDYNISKSERILNGASVVYTSHFLIKDTLTYDFEDERNYDYSNKSNDEIVMHLVKFTSNIWQVHPFGEGNTRTTALFVLNYLRFLGFNEIDVEVFKDNSAYFRNALVRANYRDVSNGIYEDSSFLYKFFSNLLLKSNFVLSNEELCINKIVV